MKNRFSLMTAAAMVASGLSYSATADDAAVKVETSVKTDSTQLHDKTDHHASKHAGRLPAGIEHKDLKDGEDIKDTIAETTEAALKKDGFDDLIERFVDADRDRLGKWDNEEGNKQRLEILNGRIAQIQKDFKAKYNKDFDIDHKVAFGDQFQGFSIVQGEIVNPTLLSNWPVENKSASGSASSSSSVSTSSDASASARIETNTTSTDVRASDKNDGVRENLKEAGNSVKDATHNITGGDKNLNKGRNVAVVMLPGKQGQELTLSMIHELPDNWKLDVPDQVTADKLYAQLLNHLTVFGDNKDQWPADVNEFHRMAAHHVMSAVYGVDAPKSQK